MTVDTSAVKRLCLYEDTANNDLLFASVRMSYRRQKRWWNAYILFYERLDVMDPNRKLDVDRSKSLWTSSLLFFSFRAQAQAD